MDAVSKLKFKLFEPYFDVFRQHSLEAKIWFSEEATWVHEYNSTIRFP